MQWLNENWHLIELLGMIAVALAAFFAVRSDVRVIKHDVRGLFVRQDALGETMKSLSELMKTVAVQDNRIDRLEEDIRDMKHGKGFVEDARTRK